METPSRNRGAMPWGPTAFARSALAAVSLLLCAMTCADADSTALRLGPQFSFLWNSDQLLAVGQALTNPEAIPWAAVLGGNAAMQRRQQEIIFKLSRSPAMVWANGGWHRHVEFDTAQHDMIGLALSRYHCRQTLRAGSIFFFNNEGQGASVLMDPEYWGEDDSLSENEDLQKVSPELCDYYNRRAQNVFEEVSQPAMRTFGGVELGWAEGHVKIMPWWMLDWATQYALTFYSK
jgi:hypothetical protein